MTHQRWESRLLQCWKKARGLRQKHTQGAKSAREQGKFLADAFDSSLLAGIGNCHSIVLKGLAVLLIAILATVLAAMPALAADLRSGETVTIASSEVIDDDLYIAATDTIIEGTVNGDIFAVGSTITINGTVNGGVSIAGETLTVNGEVARGARLAGQTININGNIDGDLLVGGNTVNVASTARIGGDLLFGAATIRIDGPVDGYIKGAGSEVTVANRVGGDIELGVERLTVTSTADLQGNLTYTSQDEADVQAGSQIGGSISRKIPEAKIEPGPLFGIGGRVVAFLMTLLAGAVMVLIAPRRAVSVAASIRRKPWLSLGWGAVILFATPIAAIVTFVTIVGVPVGLIGLTLYGIGIYLSQIVVGLFIGYWIVGYFRKVETRGILVAALALGFAALTLLKLIPYIGFPLWLATVLFGLGALVVSETQLRAEVQLPQA